MPLLTTRIEIAAPPSVVREKFLDFEQIPKYHKHGFIHTISITTPNKTPATLSKGDKMYNIVGRGSMKMKPVVKENSPRAFIWTGTVPVLFTGSHAFRFEDIEGSSGSSTLFIHEEDFSGLLGFIMGEGWVARQLGMREFTRKGFSEFNADFKAWVEGQGQGQE